MFRLSFIPYHFIHCSFRNIIMPKTTVLDGWSIDRIRANGYRAHFTVDGRYITVVLHKRTGNLYCLDSPCYHAAGPLGEGPLVDIEDIPCIRCPWHNYLVSLDTGCEVTLPTLPPNFGTDGVYRPPTFPMEPAPMAGHPHRGPLVQRIHEVGTMPNGEIFVTIDDLEVMRKRPLRSDINACHEKRGALSMEIFKIKQLEPDDIAAAKARLAEQRKASAE